MTRRRLARSTSSLKRAYFPLAFASAAVCALPISVFGEEAASDPEPHNVVLDANLEAPLPSTYEFTTSFALWQIDRHLGTISARDPDDPSNTLWSSSGVVYRARSGNDLFPYYSFLKVNGAEHCGRVYFSISEKSPLPLDDYADEKNAVYEEILLALDPNSQGRVVWKLRESDFINYIYRRFPELEDQEQSKPIVNITPTQEDGDILIVDLEEDERVYRLSIDAAVGVFLTAERLAR